MKENFDKYQRTFTKLTVLFSFASVVFAGTAALISWWQYNKTEEIKVEKFQELIQSVQTLKKESQQQLILSDTIQQRK